MAGLSGECIGMTMTTTRHYYLVAPRKEEQRDGEWKFIGRGTPDYCAHLM
jgi:hypothetical protein